MALDYSKYTDKALRNKPSKELDDVELQYVDMLAQTEVDKITNKLRDEPKFLEAVALKLAQRAIRTQNKEETNGNSFDVS